MNSCNYPTRTITIDSDANCYVCICDGWLPITVGKVTDFETIEDVFNSTVAKKLQQDVGMQKFTWCKTTDCGVTQASKYIPTYYISLNIDESCNLYCPSCRKNKIMYTEGEIFDYKVQILDRILKWLNRFEEPIVIALLGNGDPFASNIIRPLIKDFPIKDNQYFEIKTNGLLIKKQLEPNARFLDRINQFMISIDAGSKEVYEVVRKPGKWEVLIENLDFVKSRNKQAGLQFVIQKENFRDLANFISLCEKYQFHGYVQRLWNWNTWDNFTENNVLDPANENYNECQDLINQHRNNKLITFLL